MLSLGDTIKHIIINLFEKSQNVRTITHPWSTTSNSNEETFLKDVHNILKQTLKNFLKLFKECFFFDTTYIEFDQISHYSIVLSVFLEDIPEHLLLNPRYWWTNDDENSDANSS